MESDAGIRAGKEPVGYVCGDDRSPVKSARSHPPRRFIVAEQNGLDLLRASRRVTRHTKPVPPSPGIYGLISRRHAPPSPGIRTLPVAVGGRTGRPKPATFSGGPRQFKAHKNSLFTKASAKGGKPSHISFPASWWPENGTMFATTIREKAAGPSAVFNRPQTRDFSLTTPSERF